jgi:hypothetical protein
MIEELQMGKVIAFENIFPMAYHVFNLQVV